MRRHSERLGAFDPGQRLEMYGALWGNVGECPGQRLRASGSVWEHPGSVWEHLNASRSVLGASGHVEARLSTSPCYLKTICENLIGFSSWLAGLPADDRYAEPERKNPIGFSSLLACWIAGWLVA